MLLRVRPHRSILHVHTEVNGCNLSQRSGVLLME